MEVKIGTKWHTVSNIELQLETGEYFVLTGITAKKQEGLHILKITPKDLDVQRPDFKSLIIK